MLNLNKFKESFKLEIITKKLMSEDIKTFNLKEDELNKNLLIDLLDKEGITFLQENIFENESRENVYLLLNGETVYGKDIMKEKQLIKMQICKELMKLDEKISSINIAYEIYNAILYLDNVTNEEQHNFVDRFEAFGTIWNRDSLYDYTNVHSEKGEEITIEEALIGNSKLIELSNECILSWDK